MRLIDADKIPFVETNLIQTSEKIVWVGKAVIDNLPTIDAVPVVRCKDCKYFEFGDYCAEDKMEHSHCRENDFCSYGERRENDEK